MLKSITPLAVAAVLAAAPGAAEAAPTNFSSGLGCAAECVDSALVQTTVSAARIDVKTDTPARIEVVIRKRTAMGGSDPGGFTTGAIVATRESGAAPTRSFTTFVMTLEPDTLYAISVAATDAEGRRSTRGGTFRTKQPQTVGGVDGADTLKSDAGCSAQCITRVDATAGVTAAKFDVATNTPAKLVLQLSRKAPVQTGLGPFFEAGAERTYDATAGLRTSWRGDAGQTALRTRATT